MGSNASKKNQKDPTLKFDQMKLFTPQAKRYRFLIYGIDTYKSMMLNNAEGLIPHKDRVASTFAAFLSTGHALERPFHFSEQDAKTWRDLYGFSYSSVDFMALDGVTPVNVQVFQMTNCPHWCFMGTNFCFAVCDLHQSIDKEVVLEEMAKAFDSGRRHVTPSLWALVGVFGGSQEPLSNVKAENITALNEVANKLEMPCFIFDLNGGAEEVAAVRCTIQDIAMKLIEIRAENTTEIPIVQPY